VTRAREIATQGGLVLLNTTTFSAQASVSINNVFSATYTNYKVFIYVSSGSATGYVNMRLRASGSDNSASTYNSSSPYTFSNASTFNVENFASQSKFSVNYCESNARNVFTTMEIINPQASEYTGYTMQATRFVPSVVVNYSGSGQFVNTNSFDGFTVYPDSGTLTGTIRIYGIRN